MWPATASSARPRRSSFNRRARRAQPLVGGVGVGPTSDVIERAGRGEAVGDQRSDHLAVGEMGPAPHRAGPVDDAGHIQAFQHRRDQRHGAQDIAARRRIQTGERGSQIVERPRVLQLVPAAQICHNTMADLAVLVAVALHDVHVLVEPPALPHLLHTHIHFPNIIRLQRCNGWIITSQAEQSFPNTTGTPQLGQRTTTTHWTSHQRPAGTAHPGSTLSVKPQCGIRV